MLNLALAQETVSGGATPELNSQAFRPSVDARSTLWTDESLLAEDGTASGRFLLHYANDPLVYVDAGGNRTELVSGVWQLDLMGAYTFRSFRAGVVLPVYLRSYANGGTDERTGATGSGDVTLDLRWTALDRAEAPIGFAVAGRAALPTSTVPGLGGAGVGWELTAIADAALMDDRLVLAANAGTRGVPDVELENVAWGDQVFVRGGLGYSLTPDAGLSLELAKSGTYGEFQNPAAGPAEALAGTWFHVSDSWLVRAGVGAGLNQGIGAPKYRLLLAAAYEPRGPKDKDKDGITDDVDACIEVPEDIDTVLDADGCPEGVMVSVQVVDEDGKALPNAAVAVGGGSVIVGQAEEMQPGPVEVTATLDGYLPAALKAEIVNGESQVITVTMAFPKGSLKVLAVDKAGAAVPGATWVAKGPVNLPSQAAGPTAATVRSGSYTVELSAEGYRSVTRTVEVVKDKEEVIQLEMVPAKVAVTTQKIELKDSVYFETGKAIIKPESYGLLDEVAEILIAHPEITKVRIEGHTDSRGSATANKKLSQDRAASVKTYLINKGVAADRLESEGYGEERPLKKGENEAAWSVNRRVDFFVVGRSDGGEVQPAPTPPAGQ